MCAVSVAEAWLPADAMVGAAPAALVVARWVPADDAVAVAAVSPVVAAWPGDDEAVGSAPAAAVPFAAGCAAAPVVPVVVVDVAGAGSVLDVWVGWPWVDGGLWVGAAAGTVVGVPEFVVGPSEECVTGAAWPVVDEWSVVEAWLPAGAWPVLEDWLLFDECVELEEWLVLDALSEWLGELSVWLDEVVCEEPPELSACGLAWSPPVEPWSIPNSSDERDNRSSSRRALRGPLRSTLRAPRNARSSSESP
ncbi:hypothetical protein Acsp07_09830 [Actinomycetospora sp. NBRC 106378]|nr:hypothetical protein Acsp07_09830 [Actinomycetospora sp. NBRC 106378]